MSEERTADKNPEMTTCLAELEYCSTKIAGALSAVNAYTKTIALRQAGADELVAVCDILKHYISEFWNAYNQVLWLLQRPSDAEVLAILKFIEREWRDGSPPAGDGEPV